MIKAISRRQVFELSRLADLEIAERQRFYFKQFEGEDPAKISAVLHVYDHTEPLYNKPFPDLEFCVLAYDEELNGCNYEEGFSPAFSNLLTYLKTEQVILVQDLCHTWDEFGFYTKEYYRQFKNLVNGETGKTGYLLDHASLSDLVPLLFYSNPDQGDCSLYTTTDGFQLAILFWKGNLHVSFYLADLSELAAAAKHAGWVMGSRELSHKYRFGQKFG